jgi:hypothetical protein
VLNKNLLYAWRDDLDVHPAADLTPPMPLDQLVVMGGNIMNGRGFEVRA